MSQNKISSIFKNTGWFFLRFITDVIGFLPLSWSLFLGRLTGNVLYRCLGRKKQAMLKSLDIAFPEMSKKEKESIARDNAVIIAQSYMEMLYYMRHSQALSRVTIEGREYLDKALTVGKGVVGLTGHFGNFTLMHYKLAREGYPVSVVTRPMRNAKANDYFDNMRSGLKIKTIYTMPKREAALNMMKSLRANDVMIIQMDQDFREEGVWVEFFGKKASTPAGPVVLALRTGAVIVPMRIVRADDNRHTIIIEPPYELARQDSKEQTIHDNVARLTLKIEQWVRQHPCQWGWINERWKTPMPTEKESGEQGKRG
jgi:KDO2-lipid IV(A) lauroyltransferase